MIMILIMFIPAENATAFLPVSHLKSYQRSHEATLYTFCSRLEWHSRGAMMNLKVWHRS